MSFGNDSAQLVSAAETVVKTSLVLTNLNDADYLLIIRLRDDE